MRRVSIIPCNNGLGHIKRCCLIYDELTKLGIEATIFGNAERIQSFLNSRGYIGTNNVCHFEGLPSGQDYLKHGLNSFNDIFKSLAQALQDSLVISDNYYEPFVNGANGFLLANFFWSDLEDTRLANGIVKEINKAGCNLLTTIFAKSYLFDAAKINLFGGMRDQLPALGYTLVCKGLGDYSGGFEEQLELHFKDNREKTAETPRVLYIDKSISYRPFFSNYDCKFLHNGITLDIVAGADCIIGRPSVGIVTDALSHRIPFVPIYALNDDESAHNAQVLSKLYKLYGISTYDMVLMREALQYLNFDLNGEQQIAELVRKELATLKV